MQSPAVIFLVAVTIRLWAAAQLSPAKAWQYFYEYNEFARIAWAMVSGYGYSSPWANTPLAPTAVEPPVYSFLLAGIFKLAGTYTYISLWIGIGLNAVLSAITGVLILRIGKRDFGTPVGILAAWVWSCWLYEAAVAIRLWESSLAALLLVAALWWLPDLARSPRPGSWITFGLLAGMAALTNTTLLALFPLFLFWAWFASQRQGNRSSKLALAAIAVFLCTLLPWTVRNYETFRRLMPLRDNFGLELWIGNHVGATEERQYPSAFPILDPTEYNQMGEIVFMESKRNLAVQFIREHPGSFLQLSFRRFVRFWVTPEGSAWPCISLLAWIGLWLAIRREPLRFAPYAVVVLVFPAIYYVTHTFPTYRHPIEPTLLLCAAYGLMEAGKQISLTSRPLDRAKQSADTAA